jgi:hypothetical protein
MPDQENLYIPAHVDPFPYPLTRVAGSLATGGAIKIVALGSSSTAGEGDIVPYTQRLETCLRRKYPERMIDVLNRGIIGQEAPDELNRMHSDVIMENPSLVIWQVGTNAIWEHGHDFQIVSDAIAEGLERLGAEEMDVVLMDLQYAPALLTADKIDGTRRMLSKIIEIATAKGVNVFRRFDFMRRLIEAERVSFDRIIDPTDVERLHQSDWTAQRIGYELSEAIAAAAARAV